jgi:hypothetical protein
MEIHCYDDKCWDYVEQVPFWRVLYKAKPLGGDGDEATDPSDGCRSMRRICTASWAQAARRVPDNDERCRSLAGVVWGNRAILPLQR